MILGLVPIALAIWLTTVYTYKDGGISMTGYQDASMQTSNFSEQPIDGAGAGIQGISVRRWTDRNDSYRSMFHTSGSDAIFHEGGRRAITCLPPDILEMSGVSEQPLVAGGGDVQEGKVGDVRCRLIYISIHAIHAIHACHGQNAP